MGNVRIVINVPIVASFPRQRPWFERTGNNVDLGEIQFESDEERQFVRFTAKGTLPNRLFLAECRQRNVAKSVDVPYAFRTP